MLSTRFLRCKKVLNAMTLMACTALLLLASGCKSSQSAGSNSKTFPTLHRDELPARLDTLISECREWNSVKIPVKVKITSPTPITLSGTAVMEHGKGISISLRYMGMMEVGSLTVTGSTVTIIDKYHKLYLQESASTLLGDFPAGISNLQDLLLGRPFELGSESLTSANDMKLYVVASDRWEIEPVSQYKSWRYFFIANENNTLESVSLEKNRRLMAKVEYGNAQLSPVGGMITERTSVEIPGNKPIYFSLDWNVNRAKWNDDTVKLPDIPSDYRRVSAADLAGALGAV